MGHIFHGITAVAELKVPDLSPGDAVEFGIFHGITAVAELKVVAQTLHDLIEDDFPRHHRRGRIEARTASESGPLRRQFSTASPPWPN